MPPRLVETKVEVICGQQIVVRVYADKKRKERKTNRWPRNGWLMDRRFAGTFPK